MIEDVKSKILDEVDHEIESCQSMFLLSQNIKNLCEAYYYLTISEKTGAAGSSEKAEKTDDFAKVMSDKLKEAMLKSVTKAVKEPPESTGNSTPKGVIMPDRFGNANNYIGFFE